MRKNKNKSPIDTNSIHKGLIDNYNIDDTKMKKDSTSNVQDFQSVAESIEKLERIIEDGRDLAKKDDTYAEFLDGVKTNLVDQKSQLFKLKLTNAESNVSQMLSDVDEDATSNDFIAIEREIKKYSEVVFALKNEAEDSLQQKSLWSSHHNKIEIFHKRLQKKRIQRSVKASKDRVLAAIHDFEKTIDHSKYTLLRKDLTKAKRSLKKMQSTIDEAQITGQKDEAYHEWLEQEISKFDDYEKSITDVDLKIDIEQHRKALEDAQPDVVKGINELNRNIEGVDFIEEELEERTDEAEDELWETDDDVKEGDASISKRKEKIKKSPLRLFVEVTFYTGVIVALIYFTSQNYIKLRDLSNELPAKERKLHLISGSIVGNQIEMNQLVDIQNSNRAIALSKLLSNMTPSRIKLDEVIYTSDTSGGFSYMVEGEILGNNSTATRIFNKFISDLRKQPLINRVIIRDQKTLPVGGLIFTIDIKS